MQHRYHISFSYIRDTAVINELGIVVHNASLHETLDATLMSPIDRILSPWYQSTYGCYGTLPYAITALTIDFGHCGRTSIE